MIEGSSQAKRTAIEVERDVLNKILGSQRRSLGHRDGVVWCVGNYRHKFPGGTQVQEISSPTLRFYLAFNVH